jgi:HPt (histidine-containing phosphotransfer) domain-containing protein
VIPFKEPQAGAIADDSNPRRLEAEVESEFQPAVDLSVLARLIADIGAPEQSLIDAYLVQAERWIADLGIAAQEGDVDSVRRTVHSLGPSCVLIGAQNLADLLTEVERLARLGTNNLGLAVSTATAEYHRVAVTLQIRKESLAQEVSTAMRVS